MARMMQTVSRVAATKWLWVLGLATLPAFADERRTELEVSQRYEYLDNDFSAWQAQRLNVQTRGADGIAWYGAILRERRYGLWDEGIEVGTVIPLSEHWSVQPEIGTTFDTDFLPHWYADLRAQRVFSDGWISHASVRRTQYESSSVDRLALGIERYWGPWRGAYTLNISDVEGAGTPVGHAVALDRYYNDISFIGLRGNTGREEESLSNDRVLTTSVTGAGLRGRHWFDAHWAVAWDVGWVDQGELYDRYGVQLGLRRAF